MEPLFVHTPSSEAWDEVFESPGQPRPIYRGVVEMISRYDATELALRFEQLAHTFTERGVTFALGGEERPFPLDLIPRLISAVEWDALAAGVSQRVRALEAFLDDVYGAGRVFRDRVVPRALVTTSTHFRREAHGITPTRAARITVSGIDVIRDERGNFRVLEDNVRIPSGVSYVIENRRAMTQSFAGLFAHQRVHPVDDYPARLLAALRRAAPEDVTDPTVVVLTPGVHNAAYFEHVLLARMMGVELVEGRDLVAISNRVMMRTTQGDRPVHVIYRRVDDEWLDPLLFRPESTLGVAGLVNAARAGTVTIANAIGNGVADDKLLYTYVPELISYYLGETPLLDNVETYRLDDAEVLTEVVANLEKYVIKPVDGSGGKGIVIGPAADSETLETTRALVLGNPRQFIAQRPVALSTVPTFVGDRLAPRHVDLRPFAIHDGEDIWVLSGGLTRVALQEGALVVNSSQGGGSKDTWVLVETPEAEPVAAPSVVDNVSARPSFTPSPPVAGALGRQVGPPDEAEAEQ
jgi:uncharacterized circularly permuted ATP-grasp superfamily protein